MKGLHNFILIPGTVAELTTGDVTLELVKQRQEEGKEAANKPREPEQPVAAEAAAPEPGAPTLQTSDPDKEFHLGDTISK